MKSVCYEKTLRISGIKLNMMNGHLEFIAVELRLEITKTMSGN